MTYKGLDGLPRSLFQNYVVAKVMDMVFWLCQNQGFKVKVALSFWNSLPLTQERKKMQSQSTVLRSC